MRQKTDIEMELARLIKVARSEIRLKHSMACEPDLYRGMPKESRTAIRRSASVNADREINEVLPKLIQEFNEAAMYGELLELRDGEDLKHGLVKKRQLTVLDFDVECRPIAWYGGDWVTKQPTAIAWTVIKAGKPTGVGVGFIGQSFDSRKVLKEERAMLQEFVDVYNDADIVTGHFIRGFDLPLLNGALMRLNMPLLAVKDTHDTKIDLVRGQGISKSQENLGAMYELRHPKVPMNTSSWMKGNLLLPDGIEATKKRVVGDVRQHVEMRTRMLDLGHLAPVVPWTPGHNGRTDPYIP